MTESLARELESSFSKLTIRRNLEASRYCSFKLGGLLSFVFEPSCGTVLSELVRWMDTRGIVPLILGAGSNLLVSDGAFNQAIIRLPRSAARSSFLRDDSDTLTLQSARLDNSLLLEESDIKQLREGDEIFLRVDAASSLMALSRLTAEQGLSGLEFAAGIPASVGGAVAMNAGAHGSCMADTLQLLALTMFNGEYRVLPVSQLEFAYRSAGLKDPKGNLRRLSDLGLITSALLRWRKKSVAETKELRSSCLEYRRKTQPLQLPSAGSTFRNPSQSSDTQALVGDEEFVPELAAAGELLERAGLKGRQEGGVSFSELHSNWICKVNKEARTSEVDALVSLAQQRIKELYAVELFPELVRWKSKSGVLP